MRLTSQKNVLCDLLTVDLVPVKLPVFLLLMSADKPHTRDLTIANMYKAFIEAEEAEAEAEAEEEKEEKKEIQRIVNNCCEMFSPPITSTRAPAEPPGREQGSYVGKQPAT